MEQKGFISLHVLIGILFAIAMLFVVARCSSYLQIGGEASDSFEEFVREITLLEEKETGDRETFILLMQEGTAIVYFEPNRDTVFVEVKARKGTDDLTVELKNPGKCAQDSGCLCLFENPEIEEEGGYKAIITDTTKTKNCHEIETDLLINNCGIGRSHDVTSYKCTNGFVIERGLVKETGNYAYYNLGGSIVLQLEKGNNFITLEG